MDLRKLSVAAAAKSLQSCLTLCDPVDSSPPGTAVPGIFQARTLEWVAISFSNAWKWKVKVKSLSRVQLFMTPWTAAYQAPPPMGFSRQEYWRGLPLPSPKRRCLLKLLILTVYWTCQLCIKPFLCAIFFYFHPNFYEKRVIIFLWYGEGSWSSETSRLGVVWARNGAGLFYRSPIIATMLRQIVLISKRWKSLPRSLSVGFFQPQDR